MKSIRKIALYTFLTIFFLGILLFVVFLKGTIIEELGQTAYDAFFTGTIVLMSFFFLLPFFLMIKKFSGFGNYYFFWGKGKEATEIRRNGIPAKATVTGIGENSMGGTLTINNQPVLNLQLEIDDGKNPVYNVSLDTIVPRAQVPQFQLGAWLNVRIDPTDNQKVVYFPESAEIKIHHERDKIGADRWTEKDKELIKSEGKEGEAKILSVEDTGKSENFKPVVKITYEVRTGREIPYRVQKEMPLSSEIILQLRKKINNTYPAKIHPFKRDLIIVEIT